MKRMTRMAYCLVAALVLALNITVSVASGASFTPHRNAIVMTQNLYLGTDVALLLLPTTLPDLIAAVTFALQEVEFTNFAARAPRIADEIKASGPAVVGLQEAAIWSTGFTPDAPDVQFDFLALLLDALEADGAHYTPIVVRTNLDAVAPGLDQSNNLIFVRLVDRQVLLARTDLPAAELKISNLQNGTFSNLLSFFNPLVGEITIPRGWISADIKTRGKSFRFITTQLEAFDPGVQLAQANELLAGPANTPMPVALTGDFNSSADGGPDATPTYPALLAAGFTDGWAQANPSSTGDTCCQAATLDNSVSELSERLDLVLLRGGLGIRAAELVGTEPDLTAPPFWPSDHAGLVANVRVPTQATP
jgi:endonuclease/exonuclease/phosphatase family metal-dependent hydrolase